MLPSVVRSLVAGVINVSCCSCDHIENAARPAGWINIVKHEVSRQDAVSLEQSRETANEMRLSRLADES